MCGGDWGLGQEEGQGQVWVCIWGGGRPWRGVLGAGVDLGGGYLWQAGHGIDLVQGEQRPWRYLKMEGVLGPDFRGVCGSWG